MKTLYEFFSGGGMERIGLGPKFHCVFANDISPIKGAAYAAKFGRDHLRICDVAHLTVADLPAGRADLAWMGAPCVGHSEAGNRQGFDEKQSGAFWPAWSLIEKLAAQGRAPLAVGFENVTGILQRGGALEAVHQVFDRAGYQHATKTIDAAHFVPQSRERVFVIGVHRDLGADPAPLFAEAMRALPKRNIDLVDLLDLEAKGCVWEFTPAEVERHLAMMSAEQKARLDAARATGRPVAGPFARRMRGAKSGERVQRFEMRLDGLANAIRVADGGGSSKQFVLIAQGAQTRMRAIQPREAARLMGLPDSYILPVKPVDALSLCGDGVVVPVVRWLAAHVLEPILMTA
jgi:DNA (cytosine-5)-methyltransferase 1